MNHNGAIVGMKKFKSASAVMLMVSVSLMAMLAAMPPVLAANEKISGKVTVAGSGNPVQKADVLVFNMADVIFLGTQTNKTGNYTINLPKSGQYHVIISNQSYSGYETDVTVAAGENHTLNAVLQVDTTKPVLTDTSMTVTDGISTINPSMMTLTVTEKWLMGGAIKVYQVHGINANMANVTLVKEYTNRPYMDGPGRPMMDLPFAQTSPGVNTTTIEFNGTTTAAWLSDGTDAWYVPYGKPFWNAGDMDTVLCHYENNSNLNNNDGWFMEFNATTHALKQIDRYNETLGFVQNAVKLSDTTGKVQVRNEFGQFDLISGQTNTNTDPVMPFIFVKDIQPLVLSSILESGQYIITEMVSDFGQNSAMTWNTVTVDNVAPMADAGANITIKQGQVAQLNASASHDDMGIVNYSWEMWVAGSPYYLYDALVDTPVLNVIGVFQANLTVMDAGLWYDTAITFVNVTDGVEPEPDAGKDVSAMQDHQFMLNGSMSRDNYDTVAQLNYTWSFNDTVKNVTLYGVMPMYSLSKIGSYKVTLVVKDRADNVAPSVHTWVNITDGKAPDANAGPDMTVKQNHAAVFNGSASMDNVAIANYTWNFTDKGAPVKMYGKMPSYTFDVMGKYNVTLTVKDAAALTDVDSVVVTVVDGIPPVANAGMDQIDEVGVVFTFNGSGSADNVGIVTYNWSFGDGNWSIGKIVQHAFAKVQNYTVVLKCTDAQGNSATDKANITVIPKNHAPVISVIPDQFAVEATKYNLTLMPLYVKDDDGLDILNFSLSGAPAGMTINANTGIITWTPATNQVGGTYTPNIKVSDGKATVNRSFKITVYAQTIHVKVGPIKDTNGAVVKDAQVSLLSGTETHTAKTDNKGIATVDVPGQWTGRTVSVKVHKAGYNDQTFQGTVNSDGSFTPVNGYQKIKAKQTNDYAFLVIVIIVLLVLALALFSVKGSSGDKEKEEEGEEGEETLTEEE